LGNGRDIAEERSKCQKDFGYFASGSVVSKGVVINRFLEVVCSFSKPNLTYSRDLSLNEINDLSAQGNFSHAEGYCLYGKVMF
jgi:hypothetical protein